VSHPSFFLRRCVYPWSSDGVRAPGWRRLGSGTCRKKRNREDRPALISDQYHQTRIVIATAFLKLPNEIAGEIKRGLVSAAYLHSARRLTHLFSGANYEDVFTDRFNKARP